MAGHSSDGVCVVDGPHDLMYEGDQTVSGTLSDFRDLVSYVERRVESTGKSK